jgi:conjugal transfer pilus assembly protein TraW
MKRMLLGFLLAYMSHVSFSKSFGIVGETFPIKEMSFLELIELRLQKLTASGELHTIESEWQAHAEKAANRPTPVELPRATFRRSYHYDPTVVLASPIVDEHGQVLFPAGTRVNGLEQRQNYAPCWLFFNADDKAQLLWAKAQQHQCQNPKLILTGGAVRDAEQALDAVIYFDQGGRLSARFQLKAVPAIVKRDKNRLQISEVIIKENGDEV